ncbi:MAG: hypothetical protein GX758_02790, partial [Tenericutes bacterium]|nr:hypothetical protein [Mycoplasmatota bacterium]
SCNQYDSYVSITKTFNGYELKTNLVCNNETDYTIKVLGCNNFCEEKECTKTSAVITEYQFKKLVSKSSTVYSCPSGYTKSGKTCTKTKLVDSKTAVVTKTESKTDIKDATLMYDGGTKTLLSTISKKNADTVSKKYVDTLSKIVDGGTSTEKVCTTKYKTEAYSCSTSSTEKVCTTKYKKEAYTCPTSTKTEKVCTTKYKSEAYSCNCSTKYVGGVLKTSCNTCYESVPYQSCENVTTQTGGGTCYKDVPYQSCENVTSTTGGTCYRDVAYQSCENVTTTNPGTKVYYCPSNATGSEGSGSNLKCYYYKTIDNGYSYSCPSNANYSTGSGSSLKCYKVVDGTSYYKCTDNSYTLKGSKCYKTILGTTTELKCDSGYKLEGKMCKLYEKVKVNATSSKSNKTYYEYKWSTQTSLSGWTSTGKTRTVEAK